ncbi:hypothetical protein [Kribbella sp. CA-294648]|uniref:hypothetical protein n=1 Tax=Kribbella sp. CA-294648 TaxID=3239948 RepID=UPI003D8C9DE9
MSERNGRVRLLVGWGAVAACVPYLTLKLAWLTGSGVGTTGSGAGMMADPKYVVGNLLTMGMDLVAVVVALAFTYRWGQRLPSWLVLGPIWIGTGLLAPIALGLPLGMVVQGFAGGSATAADNALDDWVYGIVYGGFTVQAILLVTAFVLYARTRWPHVFRLRIKDFQGPSPIQQRAIVGAAVVASVYGALSLVWAFASGGRHAAVETAAQQTFWVTQAALSFAGAVGLLALAYRWGRGRLLLPLTAAWLGTGVVFASGLYAALAL